MKALVRKELREVFGITAAALAGYLMLVASLMGARVFDWFPGMPNGTREVPFVGGEFTVFFIFASVLFAVALGFRQSAWESSRGTYLFLLHRPVRREAIFLLKLAMGAGILVVCMSLPIVLYGTWAAAPGRHPSPFTWSMSESAWQSVLEMPLLYLGAFLSGLRPARWYGTRLLPLFASAAILLLLERVPWWWSLGLPLTVLLYGLLAANICYVARVRDYA
jgi:ABC-type transport system involved in multi-copper enzyme maturation permease subunit